MAEGRSSALDENMLIIANPGTGKTRELSVRLVELLKNGISEDDILCITFTNKAAEEMRSRISKKIKESNIPGIKPYKIRISTFHSYAMDYLREVQQDSELLSNNVIRYSIFKSFKRERAFNYSRDYVISNIVPKVENAIRYLKSFGILPDDIEIRKVGEKVSQIHLEEGINNVSVVENQKFLEYFVKAFRSYEIEKNETKNRIDYNDMLINFLKSYESAKRHYRYVLVDELQDINVLEGNIANISGDVKFFVGDRKQSIFGFQGGSIENFNKYENDDLFRKSTLSINHRSTNNIINYSKNYFLENASASYYTEELKNFTNETGQEGEKVKILITNNQNNVAAEQLVEIINNDEFRAGNKDVAIITRTNSQLSEISKILDRKGIEYTSTASSSTSNSAKRDIVSFLKGIFYDDLDKIVNALFTPFSGMTLKEAFEISERFNSRELDSDTLKEMAGPFFSIASVNFTKADISKLFVGQILPICVSIGMDYFVTGNSIHANIREFFDVSDQPTREDLFDYLEITEDSYEPIGKQKNIVLTTVHKAKGREFDYVIYCPIENRSKMSFVDAVTYSIIKDLKNVDVREELEEEKYRVDFVAFTRAKETLTVVTNTRGENRYFVEDFSEKEIVESEEESTRSPNAFNEAYALFVSGRYEEAKAKLKQKDPWLRLLIQDFFQKQTTLSYSLINASKKPYEFLKNNIMKVGEEGEGLSLGTIVHTMAHNLFSETLHEDQIPESEGPYISNLKKVNEEIESAYNAVQEDSEQSISIPVNEMFEEYSDIEDDIIFKGKIDAVFRSLNGDQYVLVDYKTDRDNKYSSEHRRQLSVYRRLFSRGNKLPEERIKVAIGYVGLRGNINTGVIDYEVDDRNPVQSAINTFKRDLNRFLTFKYDPETFIEAILNEDSDEMLFERIRNELK